MNDHKFIYDFYLVKDTFGIVREAFPVVYESDKEIVFVRGKGFTKTLNKSDRPYMNSYFHESLNNKELLSLFGNKNSTRHIYCTEYCDDFNGKKLYFQLNNTEIFMKLDNLKSLVNHFHGMYNKALKEYNDYKNNLIKLGIIEEDEDGNIEVAQE